MSSPDLSTALLLIVDMQPRFLAAVSDEDEVVRRCALALGAARFFDLPTALTEQVPDKLGATHPDLAALAPDERIFPKTAFSAFGCAKVGALIDELETNHLLLAGIETPICVYQTALAARERDMQVTVLSDAVGARRPEDGRTALEFLSRIGCHVLPTESVFYSLIADAGHPAFREFTQLVKEA